MGLFISRDDGFHKLSGEWNFFADYDDVLNHRAIELLAAAIDEETDLLQGHAVRKLKKSKVEKAKVGQKY